MRFVIALALTPETRHTIGESFFQAMDRDAFFINVARGDIVEREAFDKAIKINGLPGRGLMYFLEQAPDIADILYHPLITTTPHVGGAADASFRGAVDFIVENIKRLSDGREPCSCLNVQDINRRKTRCNR